MKVYTYTKVRSFLKHSCAILSSFKIVITFDNTSDEIKTRSADVLLKIITILKELRIAQLCPKNERTLGDQNQPSFESPPSRAIFTKY